MPNEEIINIFRQAKEEGFLIIINSDSPEVCLKKEIELYSQMFMKKLTIRDDKLEKKIAEYPEDLFDNVPNNHLNYCILHL